MGSCDVVECLSANPTCNHAYAFGYGYLCLHPRREEIVKEVEARLATDVPKVNDGKPL